MRATENLHVRALTPLKPPRQMQAELPITEAASAVIYDTREAIKRILQRRDQRLLAVVGPCSIHDPEATLDYARRLYDAHRRYHDRILIVMRAYFEKPRTTVGWRGLLNDPQLDGSFNMAAGLQLARELLLAINNLGLPTATEMLDPITPQYLADLVSFTAIGARTTESQTHRAMASGLSMPVGFKNSIDGGVQIAVNGLLSAAQPHSFLGITGEGQGCVVTTTGNPDGLVILRGSRTQTNYDSASITQAEELMREAGLTPAIMVDCSHSNSRNDYTRQESVWDTVIHQHCAQGSRVVGMMIESNIHAGKQSITADRSRLRYGVSITDGCVSWETTEHMLEKAYRALA